MTETAKAGIFTRAGERPIDSVQATPMYEVLQYLSSQAVMNYIAPDPGGNK